MSLFNDRFFSSNIFYRRVTLRSSTPSKAQAASLRPIPDIRKILGDSNRDSEVVLSDQEELSHHEEEIVTTPIDEEAVVDIFDYASVDLSEVLSVLYDIRNLLQVEADTESTELIIDPSLQNTLDSKLTTIFQRHEGTSTTGRDPPSSDVV